MCVSKCKLLSNLLYFSPIGSDSAQEDQAAYFFTNQLHMRFHTAKFSQSGVTELRFTSIPYLQIRSISDKVLETTVLNVVHIIWLYICFSYFVLSAIQNR